MKNYLLRHAQVFFYALGQLARVPLSSLMTVGVIGITLALPAALYVLIDNMQRVSGGWDGAPRISLFLKRETSGNAASMLAGRLTRLPAVAKVEHITREQALAEFRRLSGFGEALDALPDNPLPPVLIVHPSAHHADPPNLQRLAEELRGYKGVELAQLDLEWVMRLHAILQIARRLVWVLASLLALAVFMIIGNTIRLAVLNRREEIEITRLVGGTNAFIRRPFLYAGVLHGVLGGAVAWLLLSASLVLVSGPVSRLAGLYGSGFVIEGLDATASLVLLAGGGLLGWLGSRIAVGYHLRSLGPA